MMVDYTPVGRLPVIVVRFNNPRHQVIVRERVCTQGSLVCYETIEDILEIASERSCEMQRILVK